MASVRLVNPGRLRRRHHRRQPAALREFWRTHRRRGKRIVRTNARRRRRKMPTGLASYWRKVRAALSVKSKKRTNPRRKGVKHHMAKRRRRRQPAALARYWSRHRRHNTRRRRRRNPSFHFGRRRNRVVYVHRRRHHRRHNPMLSIPLTELVALTGWAVAGMAGTRIIPQMVLPSYNTGIAGYGLNFATAVGLSWLGSKFGGSRAGQGLLIGGMVGLATRVLTDMLGSTQAGAWGLSGDLDFDLGFYIPNTFAVPTTGQGPFLLNPGVVGAPMQAGGVPSPMTPAIAPASAGGTAAATGGGVTAAQLASATYAPSGNLPNDPSAWRSNWAA